LKIYGPELVQFGKFYQLFGISIIPSSWWSHSKEVQEIDDILVVCDYGNHRIVLMKKTTGNVHFIIGGKAGNALGELNHPISVVAIQCPNLPFVRIVVCDNGNNRVQVFDAETGKYLHHFNSNNPYGVTIIPQTGQLVVANHNSKTITVHQGYGSILNNNQVQMDEKKAGEIVQMIKNENGIDFGQPYGVTVNSQGHLIVCGDNPIIYVLDIQNGCKLVRSFVSNPSWGVAVDSFDNILVSNRNGGLVQIFQNDGVLLNNIKCNRPWGIVVDQNNSIFICDFGDHTVKQF